MVCPTLDALKEKPGPSFAQILKQTEMAICCSNYPVDVLTTEQMDTVLEMIRRVNRKTNAMLVWSFDKASATRLTEVGLKLGFYYRYVPVTLKIDDQTTNTEKLIEEMSVLQVNQDESASTEFNNRSARDIFQIGLIQEP